MCEVKLSVGSVMTKLGFSYISRWKPLSFIYTKVTYWSLVLGLGNMDREILNGLMLSVYVTGPWLGFKFPNITALRWIGGGSEQYDFMVT